MKKESLIGDVEELFDKFFNANYSYFDPKVDNLLKSFNAKPIEAKRVYEFYKPLYDEVKEGGEGYTHLTTKKRTNYLTFIDAVLKDADEYVKKAKKPRKPRKRKIKTAAEQTAKVKYRQECPALGLVSVAPTEIVGATTVWLYNVKYKTLTMLVSDTGCTVKGTTVMDATLNMEKSSAKILRWPDAFLKSFMAGTRYTMPNEFKNLKTKPARWSGRLNEDTIILRAFR